MLDDKLRDEIIESQKAQIDLLKWKIFLVAAIGAVALGAAPNTPKNAGLLLALIPLVCIYVDSLCLHCELRILAIARHQRTRKETSKSPEQLYEEYCQRNRSGFALVTVALLGSSVALCLLVLVVGAVGSVQTVLGICPNDTGLCKWTLIIAGSVGLAGGAFFHGFYAWRKRELDSNDD